MKGEDFTIESISPARSFFNNLSDDNISMAEIHLSSIMKELINVAAIQQPSISKYRNKVFHTRIIDNRQADCLCNSCSN